MDNMLFRVILLIIFVRRMAPLRITKFYVPGAASRDAPLDCRYDVQGGQLYGVKWYKDEQQFFECAADGSVRRFAVEGVTVEHADRANVGSCQPTLAALTAGSAGIYKCEVSLDGPSFAIDWKSSRLRVIGHPKRTQGRDEDAEERGYRDSSSTANKINKTEGNSSGVRKSCKGVLSMFLLSINVYYLFI